MVNSEKFGFRLSPMEKKVLRLVAEQEERTPADVLRRLIRSEAHQRGLWPPDGSMDEQGVDTGHE